MVIKMVIFVNEVYDEWYFFFLVMLRKCFEFLFLRLGNYLKMFFFYMMFLKIYKFICIVYEKVF